MFCVINRPVLETKTGDTLEVWQMALFPEPQSVVIEKVTQPLY